MHQMDAFVFIGYNHSNRQKSQLNASDKDSIFNTIFTYFI